MNVSRQFKQDFDLVCVRYGCPPDEIELMKRCVERDPQAAAESFRGMAHELDKSAPEAECYLTGDQYLGLGPQSDWLKERRKAA